MSETSIPIHVVGQRMSLNQLMDWHDNLTADRQHLEYELGKVRCQLAWIEQESKEIHGVELA